MGLFDFFKKKNEKENPPADTPPKPPVNPSPPTPEARPVQNEVFLLIQQYNEYIIRFIGLQQQGNYAPIAAYEKENGEIIGYVYIAGDSSFTLSVEEVIEKMKTEFEQRMSDHKIKSYTIFYHSQYDQDDNHAVANEQGEFKAISIPYKSVNGLAGTMALAYTFEEESISYKGISTFSSEENKQIFETQLVEGKDYFQEKIEIKAEEVENEIGLKIKQVNNTSLENTWCGIFGFEKFRSEQGRQILMETFALVLTMGKEQKIAPYSIFTFEGNGISYKGIKTSEGPKTILPIVNTRYAIEVENKAISEWMDVDNLEAVITGSGRDTFGIKYFATDYPENRAIYLSQKHLNIELSAVIYVLDKSEPQKEEAETKFSEDFAAYMPNKELYEFGCFDFIGIIEDFRPISIFNEKADPDGYMLEVRLINHPEIVDFFTIEMFVNKENMRFQDPEEGMRVSGVFQLQGKIQR